MQYFWYTRVFATTNATGGLYSVYCAKGCQIFQIYSASDVRKFANAIVNVSFIFSRFGDSQD